MVGKLYAIFRMSVELWTARISTRDPYRLNVTRLSAGPVGRRLAPSWDLITPFLAERERAKKENNPVIEDLAWELYTAIQRGNAH